MLNHWSPTMKIRTITTGISLNSPKEAGKILKAAEFNRQIKQCFESQGYVVQTTRLATNPWGEYLTGYSQNEIILQLQQLDRICQDAQVGVWSPNPHVSFVSIGMARTPEEIGLIPVINQNTSEAMFACSDIGNVTQGIDWENTRASAKAIKQMSEQSENGYGNFRFCAAANCPPGIPFFPASYHQGPPSFAIGLECSDLVRSAFIQAKQANSMAKAEAFLREILTEEFSQVEKIATEVAQECAIGYGGIDASIAPSLDRQDSIAYAYEILGSGKFGNQGTLTLSAMITRVLKNLSVKTCGYSGLMLPVCEDVGLAERANEKTYGLTNLLLYSAVCGCGFDTVPLPGDIPVEKLELILLDMASLAIKLDKPLGARLLPVPGKQAGDMTDFQSPYLVDCQIFAVD
jgi:uncharacterized protein (UPF0210 family)